MAKQPRQVGRDLLYVLSLMLLAVIFVLQQRAFGAAYYLRGDAEASSLVRGLVYD